MRLATRSTVAFLLGVGLVATGGCSSGSSPAPAHKANAATFQPAACPPTLSPDPAYDKARCGYLVVPQNRTHPNGRSIRLGVAIVPAASPTPAPDPIVYLSGGPGEDPIQSAKTIIDAGFNRDRDLILLSQRGMYDSQPALTCANLDEFRAVLVGLAYDSTRKDGMSEMNWPDGPDPFDYRGHSNEIDRGSSI